MTGSGQLRVIGGRFRGRKVPVPTVEEVRPVPDRLRETLFNWLRAHVVGSRCLDLYAGSGILGLESISRGAAEVLWIDRNTQVIQALRRQVSLWGIDEQGMAVCHDVQLFLRQPASQAYDIVFADPPFLSDHISWIPQLVSAGRWIKPSGYLFIKTGSGSIPLASVPGFRVWREVKMGQTVGILMVYDGAIQPD